MTRPQLSVAFLFVAVRLARADRRAHATFADILFLVAARENAARLDNEERPS